MFYVIEYLTVESKSRIHHTTLFLKKPVLQEWNVDCLSYKECFALFGVAGKPMRLCLKCANYSMVLSIEHAQD